MIFFIKNSSCVGHARVQKFINLFGKHAIETRNVIWSRDASCHPSDIVLFQGGGYGGMRLVFRYLVWMVKLTSFLLRFK